MKVEKVSFPQYVNQLQSKGKYWFFREEILNALKFSPTAFRRAVMRLVHQHRLAHMRGDFYIVVPLEYQATACLPASWFIDALMRHFEQSYYVGLLSAAALHGSAHQQPMGFQVITNKQTRPISAGQVRLAFHHKKIIKPYFYQPVKTASGTMNVSTPEMTAFDLVRYIDASGQVNNVATVLYELIEKIDPKKLALLLEEGDVEVAIAQRLGYLLEKVNGDFDLIPLEIQLRLKKPINRLLVSDPDSPILETNMRWHIFVNEPIEIDEL